MRLLDAIRFSSEYLGKSGIDDSLADAELIVLHAAGMERLSAYIDNPEISGKMFEDIKKLLERRGKGEPVQYIIEHVDFLGLKIKVGRGVLIPRPETELLALEAIKEVRSQKSKVKGKGRNLTTIILDLCAGSGCISLALARELPDADIYGTDISIAAIRHAKKNADINGIKNVTFLRGSLFEPLAESAAFDLIVSNPPYIKTSDIEGLQREIKDWEPVEALDGGPDGLDFYRRIFSEAGNRLKKGGKIILEIGSGQSADVKKFAEQSGFRDISFIKDFAGIDRILKAEV
ncbi:MAG: peptide chain release factor N(5)-glutamine methyltransferase [Nitrospirota bacterium]